MKAQIIYPALPAAGNDPCEFCHGTGFIMPRDSAQYAWIYRCCCPLGEKQPYLPTLDRPLEKH